MLNDRADTWLYRDTRLTPHLEDWRASLFTVANGLLGTRGTFEEGFSGQQAATFIHGLFVTPPGECPLLGAVPDWGGMTITIDGEPLRLDRRPPVGYERVLDMRTGVVTRRIVWKGAETGAVRVEFRRTASLADPALALLEATFQALTVPVAVALETGLDATVAGPYGPLWTAVSWEPIDSCTLRLTVDSIDGAHRLGVRTRVGGADALQLVRDPSHPRFRCEFTLAPGGSRTITKFTRYDVAYRELDGPLPPVQATFDDVALPSARMWADRWQSSTIEIGGDREAERALRFAAFHLIAGAPALGPGGIGARLLSGYGYRHHVFWDTDVYVLPYLTVTQPDLARTHLAYRYRGLPGARRKAQQHGRNGAFYAWESAGTGDEVTPMWGRLPDDEVVRIWTGELEEHITAVVAWAADHYWSWTGDDRFMAREGAEIILDGAKYWLSRLEVESGVAHLRNVIGPNEYHLPVDDSFFTNAMVAWHLRKAAALLEWLEGHDPTRLSALRESLSLPSAAGFQFRDLADRIAFPTRQGEVWEERAGFFALDSLELEAFRPCRASLHGLLGNERTQQVRLVKQADVLMALVLLEELRTPGALEANFDYYAPITDHGSSLSLAMHSLAASTIGRPDQAYEYFRAAVDIDHADAMERGGHGIHAAAQGGILQAALFGFGGLTLAGGAPTTVGRLPDNWDWLGFSFVHRGTKHEREVGPRSRSSLHSIGREQRERRRRV